MACTYSYTARNGVTLTGNSIEELRDKVINNGESFKEEWVDKNFVFYDTGRSLDETKQIVSEMKSKGKNSKGDQTVTELANEHSYGGKGSSVLIGKFGEVQELCQKFSQKFGTYIHGAIEFSESSEEYKKNMDLIVDLIDNFVNQINKDEDRKNIVAQNQSNYIGQLFAFCTTFKNNRPRIESEISKVVSAIKVHVLSDKTILVQEENIIQKDKLGSGVLYGKPDLVLIDGSGKLVIIDFKTSPKNFMSDATKKYHYMQLQSYRKIFGSWGIPESDITGQNILITFNAGGITFDPSTGIINPEEDIAGEIKGQVNNILNKYFPIQAKGTTEEKKKKIDRIKRKHAAFCDGQMLKRYSTESMIKQLTDAAKNGKRKYLHSLQKVVELKLSGDNIVAYDLKDATQILGPIKVEDLVKQEQNKLQEITAENTYTFKQILIEKDPSKLKNFLAHNPDGSKSMWENLYKYCSMSYEYVSCPELEQLGIITMKHATRGYEFIQLVSDASNLQFCQDPNANILRSVITDKKVLDKYKEAGELERGSIGNLYALRALMAISEFKDSFTNFKLNQINVISVNSGHSLGIIDNSNLKKTLQVLQKCSQDAPQLENTELFTDCYDLIKSIPMSTIDEQWAYTVVDALNAASYEYGDSNLRVLSDWKKLGNIEEKLNKLQDLQQHIELKYADQLQAADQTGKSRTDESIIFIYNLVKTLQNQLRDMVDNENEMNSYSINFQESIVAGINLLTKGSIAEFTKSGLQLTGLAQGLSNSTAYSSPSRIIQRFQHFYDVATSQIMLELSVEAAELNKATEKFIAWGKKHGDIFADSIRGNHDKLYSSLFQKKNGEISSDMLFENPYSRDCKLAPEQKNYLEVVLWTINRHKIGDKSWNIQKMSYAELKQSPEDFEKYKNLVCQNSKFLEIPLKRKGGIQGTSSSFMSVIKGKKTISEFTKDEIKKCRSIIEREFLDDNQTQQRDTVAKERKRYINYFKENDLSRTTRTENTRPEEWDFNLNVVTIEYALADLKQKYFDELLKIADNQFAAITILEQVTGQDLSAQVKELTDRIHVSIYNKSLVDDEFKDFISALGFVKSGMALTKIAVRPALMMKEMLLGRIRNTATILADQISQDEWNKIKLSHLMDAAKEVFGENFFKEEGLKFISQLPMGHKSIADLLNDTYGINDRDLSVIGDKFSYDRYGLHNWASRMLYMNTIAPDWFNRMILFIAKMKADGTFDAHSIGENGELVYDISKDKRVAEYWNNRHHPKNTSEYLRAKEYYILKMQQFEREGYRNPDGSALSYSDAKQDPFPRAYTTQEEESAKEQIGLVYGYYSHQERSTMQKGLWWTMYTNFMTYLPSQVRKYLATGKDSSIIKTIHKKDAITGKPLYWKPSVEGELTEMTTDTVDKETGQLLRPVLETVSDPYQGLLLSTIKTVGQVCRGEFDQIQKDPKQLKATELFLFNNLFAILIAAIIMAITQSGTNKGIGVNITADILNKSAQELDMYHSIMQPVGNLGIVGTDFLNNVFTSSYRGIANDGYSMLDFANSNFAIVKDMHLNLLNA